MKVTAPFKYEWPFESWTLQMSTTGQTSYAFSESHSGLVISGSGLNMYLVAENQLPLTSQVRNLRDREGNEILVVGGTPYPMYVIEAAPQFDPFGRLVAWRHALRRELPKDFAAIIADLGA